MGGIQVFAQAEHVVEIVRADLHRRLTNLVRGRWQRMLVAFQDQDVQLRKLAAQLQRQRETSQTAAEDDYVACHLRARAGDSVGGHGDTASRVSSCTFELASTTIGAARDR